jgi:GT2 family glycosyltransferase
MPAELEFSVILPVCHGGIFLRKALASLRGLDFPPGRFEVLVAGADDDRESYKAVADEAVSAAYAISFIPCGSANRSALLNAACAAARGGFLAFTDDDCMVPPEWLRRFSAVFYNSRDVGIAGGCDEMAGGGSAFDTAIDRVLNSFIGSGGLRRGAGIRVGEYYPKLWNMAVPHETVLNVALKNGDGLPQVFKESLVVHEDVDLADRIRGLGKKLAFAPEVRMRHHRDTTFRSFVRRNFRMARTCRSLGIHRFPHTVLAVFALGALSLSITSLLYERLWILLLIFTGTYAIPLLAVSIDGLRKTRNLAASLIVLPLLVSLHFARGFGYLFPLRNREG